MEELTQPKGHLVAPPTLTLVRETRLGSSRRKARAKSGGEYDKYLVAITKRSKQVATINKRERCTDTPNIRHLG